MFQSTVAEFERSPPEAVVLIDYPGFNLRLAREAKRRGIRVIYYISPQLWAWGRGRLRKMAERVDLMLVILPFEETMYREAASSQASQQDMGAEAQEQPESEAGGSDEDVVDAEYEVVDDDKNAQS